MESRSIFPLCFLLVLLLLYGCKQEDLSPVLGRVIFSPSPRTTPSNDGRVSEEPIPAFVLLSIKDGNDTLQENIKLSLFAFGQGYVSEDLQLQTDTYQLTQFIVFDVANHVIYSAPTAGSDFARYVTHPLPLDFVIAENQNITVIPAVLAVPNSDNPESFGMLPSRTISIGKL